MPSGHCFEVEYTEFLEEVRKFFSCGGAPVEGDALKDWFEILECENVSRSDFKKVVLHIVKTTEKPFYVNFVFEANYRLREIRDRKRAELEQKELDAYIKKAQEDYKGLTEEEKRERRDVIKNLKLKDLSKRGKDAKDVNEAEDDNTERGRKDHAE